MRKCKYFFLIFFILFIFIESQAQRNYIRFEHYSLEQGISQATIYDIVQDKKGFLWFATEDGLNRFDGYDFKVYYSNPQNPKALQYKRLYSLLVDKNGDLWVGTLGAGLAKYNSQTDDFTNYMNEKNNPNSLSADIIQSLYEDKEGTLWIGTAEGGLCRFNKKSNTFSTWMNSPANQKSLSHNVIRSISEDENGNLWLATNGKGLNMFIKQTEEFVRYNHNPNDTTSLSDDELNAVYADKKGFVWVGTAKKGLCRLDLKTGKFTSFKNNLKNPNSIINNQVMKIVEDSKGDLWIGTFGGLCRLTKENRNKGFFINYINSASDPYSISNNYIRSIYEDRSGILWFGTYQDGVNKYNRDNQKFIHYKNHVGNTNSLINNSVRTFAEDKDRNIWIGTYGGGIDCFNPKTENFKHYQNNPQNQNSLSNDIVNTVVYDNRNYLWIGNQGNGIDKYDINTNTFTHYSNNPNNPKSLSNNFVKALLIDKDGFIWICTGVGLNRFDEKTNTFTRFFNNKKDENSLADDRLMSICEDEDGFLWIGTANKGVDKFDKTTGKFTHFRHSDKDSKTISNNRIMCLYQNKTGKEKYIWVGTGGGGINKIDPKTGKITYYTRLEGLANDIVYGIVEDNDGNLWLSTNYGISKMNLNAKNNEPLFKNYVQKEGLQSNAFNEGAYFKSADGTIYLGGTNGFNIFSANHLKNNSNIPPVYIIDFSILNVQVPIGKTSVLNKNIVETDTINLTYRDYIFSFVFSALDYSNPDKNQYLYKMEGFEDSWNKTDGRRRFVTYTNLSHGDYIFKVKGSNNDGIWNEQGKEIIIHIAPPIWKTTWFYITCVIFLILAIYIFFRQRLYKLKEAKRILEEKVKERTAEIRQQKEEIMSQAEQLEITNRELEKLSIVARETDNAIAIFDSDGNLEWVNHGFTRLFGYTFNEFIENFGANIFQNSNNKEIQQLILACINEKKSVLYESTSKTKSNKAIWVQTTLTPIYDEFGKLKKIIAIDSDITRIKQAESEILKKNEEISVQKDILQHQNEDIKGSIRYAKTIQQAILPSQIMMNQFFETFIIYQPKDIVSGDFYWFSHVNLNSEITDINEINYADLSKIEKKCIQCDKYFFIAVVDCTGHGVPGAFMSMIGNRLINEIIIERKTYSPSLILEDLNKHIRIALKQDESDNNDGMDVCLCRIQLTENKNYEIVFSGAKRPLFYFHNQQNKIQILSGDRKTIGGTKLRRSEINFTNQSIYLEKDDIIYLSTDGIIDQNNYLRKRFGTQHLIEYLSQIATMNLSEQKENILKEVALFQKDETQRDDITMIGLKL